jgi:hypothetical protein
VGGVPASVERGGWLLALAFVVTLGGILLAVELGRRIGVRQRAAGTGGADAGVGAMDGVVFALFGLLVAFVFFGSAGRFDRRRDLITSSATAIRTAYLRVDMLPADAQPEVRGLYRRYLESLLAITASPTAGAAMEEYDRTTAIQDQIWTASLAAAQRNPPSFGLVASSVNDMIALTTSRLAVARTHTPLSVFGFLFGLALLCAFLAGRAMAAGGRRNWLNTTVFAAVVAASMSTIVDFEFPRLGFMRLDTADQPLVELLASVKAREGAERASPSARSRPLGAERSRPGRSDVGAAGGQGH